MQCRSRYKKKWYDFGDLDPGIFLWTVQDGAVVHIFDSNLIGSVRRALAEDYIFNILQNIFFLKAHTRKTSSYLTPCSQKH